MAGRGYSVFDTGIGRCGIVWSDAGVVGVQLPEAREIETRRRLFQLYPEARETRAPLNVEIAIEGMVALLRGQPADLSDIALDWMQQRLASVGVAFAAPGPYVPDLTHGTQAFHTPWAQAPFNLAPQVARTPLSGDVFDPSVQQHWLACADYQRAAWPTGFA